MAIEQAIGVQHTKGEERTLALLKRTPDKHRPVVVAVGGGGGCVGGGGPGELFGLSRC